MNEIVTLLAHVKRKLGETPGRLYFHFSGHGLTTYDGFTFQTGILASDYTNSLMQNSLSIRSIQEFFRYTALSSQFYFIDACRNVPEQKRFRMGHMPPPQEEPESGPSTVAAQQFVMYATSKGLKTAELDFVGLEGGVFTNALLKGLAGEQSAKAYDEDSQSYVVRWDSLLTYIGKEMEKLKNVLKLRSPEEAKLIQSPKDDASDRGGFGCDQNPVLSQLPLNKFAPETLDVHLEPPAAVPVASVALFDQTKPGPPIDMRTQISDLPVQFLVPPKPYRLKAQAQGYEPAKDSWPVEIYERQSKTLKLIPCVPASRPPGDGGPPGSDSPRSPLPSTPSPTPAFTLEGSTSPSGSAEACKTATLTARVGSDGLAKVELLDMSGKVLLVSEGLLQKEDLVPGVYRVRYRTPEGQSAEELVAAEAGDQLSVELKLPPPIETPLLRDIANGTGFNWEPGGFVISSKVEPMADGELSTVLAIGGMAANFLPKESDWGARLGRLELPNRTDAFKGAESGFYALFGDELAFALGRGNDVERVTLRLWSMTHAPNGSPSPVQPHPRFKGLGDFACPTAVGMHWLGIESPGMQPIAMAVNQLPGRLTYLVFHRRANAEVGIYLYTPELNPSGVFDPNAIRRVEFMQRSILRGRYADIGDPSKLEKIGWSQPLVGLFAAYLMLRAGRIREAKKLAARMVTNWPKWSDAHLILAECLSANKETGDAIASYRFALDHGVPVFAGGLARLQSGVQRYHIEHPRVSKLNEIVTQRIPGVLWACCAQSALNHDQMHDTSLDARKKFEELMRATQFEEKIIVKPHTSNEGGLTM